ncbi:MAG TPA: tetratricopeptide repeat protein [Polyangia bacterium]|nr:tetratricopeptide repeat protein [Polyangia bacterium]
MRGVVRVAVALGVAGLLACAHEPSRPAPPRSAPPGTTARATGNPEIVLGPEALQGSARRRGAWLLYGAAKAGAYLAWKAPAANESADDFELELAARNALSETWSGGQENTGAEADATLDRQAEIWRAGFLPELVVAIYSRPGWTIPPTTIATLRLDEFTKRFPGEYTPGAPVVLKLPSGKVHPDVPGADFPDPETLPYGAGSCFLAREARRAAWERWAALEPRLGGAPLAASSTLDLAHQLTVMKRDSARVARGATWVAWRVAHLAALEGFCAIEAQDWPRAYSWLERAVSMSPASPNPRLELSMAVMMMGKRREALAIADDVRGWSDDGCAVAAAWRRRGYILIDLGDLAGARDAYERSLALEPQSAIARQELASIAAAIQANPAAGTRALGPPPAGDVQVTQCHRQ